MAGNHLLAPCKHETHSLKAKRKFTMNQSPAILATLGVAHVPPCVRVHHRSYLGWLPRQLSRLALISLCALPALAWSAVDVGKAAEAAESIHRAWKERQASRAAAKPQAPPGDSASGAAPSAPGQATPAALGGAAAITPTPNAAPQSGMAMREISSHRMKWRMEYCSRTQPQEVTCSFSVLNEVGDERMTVFHGRVAMIDSNGNEYIAKSGGFGLNETDRPALPSGVRVTATYRFVSVDPRATSIARFAVRDASVMWSDIPLTSDGAMPLREAGAAAGTGVAAGATAAAGGLKRLFGGRSAHSASAPGNAAAAAPPPTKVVTQAQAPQAAAVGVSAAPTSTPSTAAATPPPAKVVAAPQAPQPAPAADRAAPPAAPAVTPPPKQPVKSAAADSASK